MIGMTRTVWAMIIAVGVNNNSNDPTGPRREKRRNITSPTTTGGRPIKVLTPLIIHPLPLNDPSPSPTPAGIPITAATKTAEMLTTRERKIIP